MLQLKDIRKAYVTDSYEQMALDGVSVTFRDNEFVAVLGPSGSGKTTMLNILGGLDHADSGEIVINGVSTTDYSAKDWDSYRNHRIGFVFQSYNLIPHQSILSNVELALTLAGVGLAERRARARTALERVGLGDHVGKRPSQLSGGQMQRVAIARALVNDPDIVLADEPTGALDTETGIQIMDLLKEVARDRLVIMVTHNPELAESYATRVVRLHDGRLTDDTDPFVSEIADGVATKVLDARPKKRSRDRERASMSFATALALSFNNLMTKKGRTALTAFAGSIGIIGIAAILALSNGVNDYIARTEEDALTSYPLTVTKSSFDVSSLLSSGVMGGIGGSSGEAQGAGSDQDPDSIPEYTVMTDMFANVKNNDLGSFKKYLDSGDSGIEPYVNTIQYSYGIRPQVYRTDTSGGVVRLSPSKMESTLTSGVMGSALMGGTATSSSFTELVDDADMLRSQADLVEGSWPTNYDEVVLILDSRGQVSDYTLYSIGYYDPEIMNEMTQNALKGEEVSAPETACDFTKEKALGMTFTVVPACDLYQKNGGQGTWSDMTGDTGYMKSAIEKGIRLKVVGIVRPKDSSVRLMEGIGYSPKLTRELMRRAQESQVVKDQLANPDVDVFTGKTFEELQSEQGASFDMSNLFTVDTDALRKAFSFDTSALSSVASSGSGLDLSGIGLDSSAFDPSVMKVDPSAMQGVFSEDSLRQIMAGAPKFDLESAGITDAASGLTDEQRKAINDASTRLAAGYAAWAIQNPEAAKADDSMSKYLATPEATAITGQLSEELGTSMNDIMNVALQKYMSEQFAPYLSKQMQALMQSAAQIMALQLAQQMQTQMSVATAQLGSQLSAAISGQLQGQMAQLSGALKNGFRVDPNAFASAIHLNMDQNDLTSLLTNYMNAGDLSYTGNLDKLGYADESEPKSISIYPKDFAAKESVLSIIDGYNGMRKDEGREDETIQYSDIAGVLMSSVTDIVNMISLVLIAFVSISLVVSSIMIGIITYISVLERKKEIGILRAMGASRLNVANVFNAETVIEGFISGVFAVAFVYLVSAGVNAIVYETQGIEGIMSLPLGSALALIAISVFLTFVAGIMPAANASRRDPVEALRSE
ncbi:ABC transporter ATP-binding protein/permease [Parafannyhessea umbonata]|uniref:ABC-type lipoprotein export system, ATPase component n=1 Tax=Parafannyhessea umbonata TaxID=604330 RepID=A0A1H9P1C4_9ACTN|nr:ABC transporter ATP-binding protein/permease [Parafannyhessea umbonata]SER41705.1 ABC-type lipoprotein export system, ATPase component [Parafannyhessea umbonata]